MVLATLWGELHAWLYDARRYAWDGRWWMGWNLVLAVVPVLLSFVLAARFDPRRTRWWLLAAVFVAFLPNAPYLVTDLVHVHDPIDGALKPVAGFPVPELVLGSLALVGLVLYSIALGQVERTLARLGWATARGWVLGALHVLCAIGVVIGRVGRANSWDALVSPTGLIDRVSLAFQWGLAGIAVVLIAIGLAAWHAFAMAAWRAARGAVERVPRARLPFRP